MKSKGQLPSSTIVQWTNYHQLILENLLDDSVDPPVMAYPDFTKPFIVCTDASEEGLGAVLYQSQNGETRVIAYTSQSLTPAERNYHHHSGKLEFLALKWAICDHSPDYLYYASQFTVYTDNNALTYILSSAKLNATDLRWVGELADLNFTIKYRPGKVNTDADALSSFYQMSIVKWSCAPRKLQCILSKPWNHQFWNSKRVTSAGSQLLLQIRMC
jgi:hypothetical protein